eukprot:13035022-Alexandrium_andersonii.AAC.1
MYFGRVTNSAHQRTTVWPAQRHVDLEVCCPSVLVDIAGYFVLQGRGSARAITSSRIGNRMR